MLRTACGASTHNSLTYSNRTTKNIKQVAPNFPLLQISALLLVAFIGATRGYRTFIQLGLQTFRGKLYGECLSLGLSSKRKCSLVLASTARCGNEDAVGHADERNAMAVKETAPTLMRMTEQRLMCTSHRARNPSHKEL